MRSKYKFSTKPGSSSKQYDGGVRTKVDKSQLPILDGLSLYLLELDPGGIREPHWHVNAHELCYCISGVVKITVFAPEFSHDSLVLEKGSVAYIPKAYLHCIENIGPTKAVLAVGFNHDTPEELSLSTIFSASGPSVMSATFDVDADVFKSIPRQDADLVITKSKSPPNSHSQEHRLPNLPLSKSGLHKFKLEGIDPQVDVPGGTISLCHVQNFPILKGITVYDLRLSKGGVREPHWHPNAAEMDYVVKGSARMLIMSPDGVKDVFEVHEGDVVYIPAAYFHYIENIGEEEMHFAVFFNHENPEDIGITGSMGGMPPSVSATVLKTDLNTITPLCQYREDVFIGPRLLR